MRSFSTLLALFGTLAATTTALNTIEVKEQEFVDSQSGDRFVIIGVDYQPGGESAVGTGNGDPLSDPATCLRDAALMQNLGVNTIRTYNVDPTLNHDECVSIFNSVGIYMIIDVNTPLDGQYINRADPKSTYNAAYLKHIFTTVEAFMNYPNLLGFFAGNELINDIPTAKLDPPYIRAVQRDLKNYIAKNAPRQIPVGYSAADVRDVLEDTWAYLQCQLGTGTDMSRSDFFGLNSYSWCGQSSYTDSQYNQLVAMFQHTTIPVFFSEYGCNEVLPRVFDEVPTLYGPKMTVMSGGLVYQWTQDSNNYGLIQTNTNGSAELLVDYDNLEAKYNTLNINLLTSQNNTATSLTPPKCNANLISSDGFSTSFSIPDPPNGAAELIANGVAPANNGGSIVPVTQTSVSYPVYATNGAQLQNLHIQTGSGVNSPGAKTGAAATASTSGSTAGAPRQTMVARGAVAAAALGGLAFAL